MKKKFLTVLGAALSAVIAVGSFSASAKNDTDTIGRAQSLADGIIDFKLTQTGAETVQDWIDDGLTENAGLSSEWYIFALSRSGNYDFSGYQSALLDYLSENEVRSASSRLKYALVLASAGSNSGYISEIIDDSVGGQGVMSVIYGLHLMNNGYEGDTRNSENTVSELLSLQKSDGGWAVMGDTGETDATAIAVQALAPHYDGSEAVKAAVDKALSLLSERQLKGGDFASYGVPNPESTAQVLVMLTSLGIDPEIDSRFIKNGNTLLDGLALYRNNDGSFSHEAGKEYNETATVQTFYSLIAYLRFSEGETPLYIFENDSGNSEIAASPEITEEKEPVVLGKADSTEKKPDYKPSACLIIAGIGVIGAIILILLKKRKKQNFIVLAVICGLAVLFVIFTDFSSAEDYYGEIAEKDNPIGTVTLSIRCDTIVGKSHADYIPNDGIIMDDTFEIEENETAFDILVEGAKKHSVQLDYSGASGAVYVAGIGYLYEFDFGDLSGWMYLVNGEKPSVGCDGYILSDGDVIEFLYTCEMGSDLT